MAAELDPHGWAEQLIWQTTFDQAQSRATPLGACMVLADDVVRAWRARHAGQVPRGYQGWFQGVGDRGR